MRTIKFSLVAIAVIFSLNVSAALTKRVYRNYPLSKVQKLEINNKYGHIYIDDNRKDSVIIDVKIWVEGNTERSQKLLEKINVSIVVEGKTVVAVTNVESFSNNSKEFGIDYHISIPADRDLAVVQKYGTVSMKNLTGRGDLVIAYGELTAAKLLSPELKMDISYSKANIEETRNLNLDLKYSKFFLDRGQGIKSETKYSDVNLGTMTSVFTDSKYDQYKIASVGSFKVNAMYTATNVDQLTTSFDATNGYGSLRIENIHPGFENIRLVNKYAVVKLGISPEASYRLEGNVRYCDLKHPEGKLNISRGNTSYSVNGVIGKNPSPKSTVTIESTYGSVKLMP